MANYGVAMSLKKARMYRNTFFGPEGYNGVARWHEHTINEVKPNGYTRTLSGRIRYLKEEAHNEYYNTPVQGSGADGLKAAMRCVYFRLKKQFGAWDGAAKMVHHVHDEIILDTEDSAEVDFLARRELCAGMEEGMAQFLTKTPVKVEPESGDSWGTAKG
jgi:DNA polymerase-1